MTDCYLKEFEAEVKEVTGKFIILDQSAFYPEAGGQPTDTGKLICDGQEYNVVFIKKISGSISHEVEREGLKPGDKVNGIINWDRRHLFMRYHTACHILSTIVHNATAAHITGNQISTEKARIDFNLENFDRDQLGEYGKRANEIIEKNLPVEIKIMPRDEAFKIPAIVKLKMMLPESIKEIRVIDIEGFDQQACGGCHVKNTSEIGKLEITKAENKGKSNRRVYFVLK
jgi:misacylated tRNA(Ala) deacylase